MAAVANWDIRHMELAKCVARSSKDPSTQVGCVVVRPDQTLASTGFNGFARGVNDTPERYADREVKYALVVHAEANAIVTAREPLHGYTAYVWPLPPCSNCASLLVQAGIRRVVCARPTSDAWLARWAESFKLTSIIFEETGIISDLLEDE